MASYPHLSIEVVQEDEEVFSFTSERVPDPNWTYVDKKGHGHFWKKEKLPTLKGVTTGVGYYDDGTEYSITEMRCKHCDEKVEPGMKLQTVQPPPPMVWFKVTIGDLQWSLTPAQYGDAIEALSEHLQENHHSIHLGRTFSV